MVFHIILKNGVNEREANVVSDERANVVLHYWTNELFNKKIKNKEYMVKKLVSLEEN